MSYDLCGTGTCGGSLHAGPRLHNGLSGTATGYGMAHGRAYSEGVNVQWALSDATAAEGGCFVCIPGEQQTPYPSKDSRLHIKHITLVANLKQ